MELYGERGFDQTTVAEIAARAGLTERTFFRHYADKREVLFAGGEMLAELLVAAVAGAPDSATALAAVAGALEQVGARIQESAATTSRAPGAIPSSPRTRSFQGAS